MNGCTGWIWQQGTPDKIYRGRVSLALETASKKKTASAVFPWKMALDPLAQPGNGPPGPGKADQDRGSNQEGNDGQQS